MADPVRIGVLGRGTVGAAFARLLAERADAVEAATGRRPEPAGTLTRSEGDFGEILERSDLIVELIGGTDPARAFVLDALRAGRPVVTANKQLLAQHGEELFGVAREAGVQLRFEAAVAGVIPIVRTIQESFGVTEIEKVFGIVNGTTNFILTEMASTGADYAQVLARAQELGYAEADPTDDVNGADAAAKMAILARLAFHTPVTLDQVAYEGIEQVKPDDLAYAKEFDLSLKLLGVAERHEGGISVRVFPCFLYGGHPLAPVGGPFNAVMVEAPEITEVTMSGPGAGGVQTASAVLGDVVSILSGDAPVHETRERLPIVSDITSSFYLHLAVADRPGVLASVAKVLGDEDVSVKSVVQRGTGEDARLVMVIHECLESRFSAALEAIDQLDVLRSPPRWNVLGRTVRLCENPNLVAIAADRLGRRCAPLVCTDGMPGAAQRCLLSQLAGAGAELRYHGDFDWPGLHIGNLVMREYGARPWRFGSPDYFAAIESAPRGGQSLDERPVEATWDTALTAAMQRHRIAIAEEAVAATLLQDLDERPGFSPRATPHDRERPIGS